MHSTFSEIIAGHTIEKRNTLPEYEQFVDDVWLSSPDPVYENEWHRKYMELRDLFVMSAGVGGESGEVLEKIKKFVRDGTLDMPNLAKELGDVLYYIVKIAHRHGLTLQDVIDINVMKLSARLANNTMRGSGDNR